MATEVVTAGRLPRRDRRTFTSLAPRPVQLAIIVGAALTGLAAAFAPELAVAGVVGLALVPIVFARPIVGLCAILVLSFLETFAAISGALSVTKLLGLVLILAWLALVVTSSRAEREGEGLVSREPLLAASLVLLVAWAAVSLVWAGDQAEAKSAVMRFALNFVLFPIALLAVRKPRDAAWLVGMFIVGALVAAAFGLSQGTLEDPENEGRLKGAGLNPNQLGSYLVVAAIFAATLVGHRRWAPLTRAGAMGVACLAAIFVFMTLSRGALLGLACALVLAPIVAGRGRRTGTVFLLAFVLVGATGWYTMIAPERALERLTSAEESGGSGRTDLWRVGWRMVEAHPVQGVGAGNFRVEAPNYVLRPGATQRDDIIIDDRRVAHNVYLTVLSELGAVGLALFIAIAAVSLRSALLAAARFARRGDLLMELLSRALFLALVSILAAGFFSSSLYSKQLWFLFAMAPALLAIADRGERIQRVAPGRLTAVQDGWRRARG